jgi:hypothetical protein
MRSNMSNVYVDKNKMKLFREKGVESWRCVSVFNRRSLFSLEKI